jgi:hypothetical protein
MKIVALAVIPALALAGCQTMDQMDTWFARNKPKICSGIVTQHGLFEIGVRTGEVAQKYVDLEAKLYSRALVVCNNPNAQVTDALIAAADAYRTLLKKAKVK